MSRKQTYFNTFVFVALSKVAGKFTLIEGTDFSV